MRCLFVVDQLPPYRDVAAALNAEGATMVLLKESGPAEQIAQKARFDIAIVGANTFTSEPMKFLHRQRTRSCPLLAVTGEPWLREMLLDLGAERAVVLPDGERKLQIALSTLLKQGAAKPLPKGIRPSGDQSGRRPMVARYGTQPAANGARAPDDAASGDRLVKAGRPLRVLIVEPDALVALDLAVMVEAAGGQLVGTAAAADDAYILVASTTPDIVVMDARLGGGIDGVSAAQAIRKSCAAPVVFVTGKTDAATIARIRAFNGTKPVVKPVGGDDLPAAILLASR